MTVVLESFLIVPFLCSSPGEIHELKQELNMMDRGKKKDAVKKVIAGERMLTLYRFFV